MRSNNLFAFLFGFTFLAACGGEDMLTPVKEQPAKPDINIHLPDIRITQTATVVQTSTIVITGCVGNPQVCGSDTVCDETLDRCVELDPWAELNQLCPEFDYRITQLTRTATNVYRAGDEAALFEIELETCNWIELERVTIAIPILSNGAPIFEYVRAVENEQRTIGAAYPVSNNGHIVIGLEGYQLTPGQRVKLGFYGKLRAVVPAGHYGSILLSAMFARRIDDSIARLATALIVDTIEVRDSNPGCLPDSTIQVFPHSTEEAGISDTAWVHSNFIGGAQDVRVMMVEVSVSGFNATSIDCITLNDGQNTVLYQYCAGLPGNVNVSFNLGVSPLIIPARSSKVVSLGFTMRNSAMVGAATAVAITSMALRGQQDGCDAGWVGSSIQAFVTR